jgi:hypothetical protein
MRLSLLWPAGWRCVAAAFLLIVSGCSAGAPGLPSPSSDSARFGLIEASISDIHAAYRSKQLTARRLVESNLARIDAYDKNGPNINSIITIRLAYAYEQGTHHRRPPETTPTLVGEP